MALINFSNVTKYYVNDLILDHVSFQINKNDRVALIGNNGVGKTTLFKLILKIEEPTLVQKEDKVGDISILNGISIGYLNQNAIENIENTVFEELLSVFKKTIDIEKDLEKISEKINVCNDEDTLNKYDKLVASGKLFTFKFVTTLLFGILFIKALLTAPALSEINMLFNPISIHSVSFIFVLYKIE